MQAYAHKMCLSCVLYVKYFFSELEQCCKAANHNSRESTTLRCIFDVKAWLLPALEEIHGHTVPHVFLFRRNAQGRAVMFYKHWSHEPWQPQEGLTLLKVIWILSNCCSHAMAM